MKTTLYALLLVSVIAITQDQVDALIRWGICPFPTVATANCDWATTCFYLDCANDQVVGLQFDKFKYLSVNATDRLLWANFPELTSITVYGGTGPATVPLYPEFGLVTKLVSLNFLATASGTIPNEIGMLRNLRRFSVTSALSGTIPAGFAEMPMERFELISGVGSNLEGPVPNFTNVSVCHLSRDSNTVDDNSNLFCVCNGTCAAGGGYNRCSVACGRITTAGCNEAVATLHNGYVCLDACRRCGTQCFLLGTSYRCPGDPTNAPPPATESSRTTPTIDGGDDSSNPAARNKLF